MNYQELKDLISAIEEPRSETITKILAEISSLINNKATLDQGRDLVIRSLAKLRFLNTNEQELLFYLVRAVGLFPYVADYHEHLEISDRLAFEAHRAPNLGVDVVFHSLQAKVFHLLSEGNNVILSAATSVGKSLIIDAIIASKAHNKIVIVVPTIALIDETRRRLNRKFRELCNIITHPSQNQKDEKLNVYILTQERVLQRDDLNDVNFFVIDEFYKLDLSIDRDLSRAIDLNLAFHKLAKAGGQFYLLGPNIQSIRGLDKHQFVFVPSDFTTVAVDFIPFNLPTRGEERQEKLVELCKQLQTPTIIYCQSPASANHVANLLINSLDHSPSKHTTSVSAWIGEHYHKEWDVCKAIEDGIGIHHGGVPRALQQYFIRLFNDRVIKFLICTSTIIEGVNTSAENVIIYDRRKENSLIDYFTYKNISGRAGRMGQYFVGKVFVLEEAPKSEDFNVDFPIGLQAESTPLGLLMELDTESLSDLSKERLESAFRSSILSKETLIANRQLPIESQIQLSDAILSNLHYYHKNLSWRSIPDATELETICELLYDHLLGGSLQQYNIHSGAGLAWHINNLRIKKNLSTYLEEAIAWRRDEQSVSDAINTALRFIRNMICYRIPRDIAAINRIQTEIFQKTGRKPGDFTYFSSQMETLFVDPLLFALDEYGIPIQVSEKLSDALLPAENLDSVLTKIKRLNLERFNLSEFELEVTQNAKAEL